MQERRGRGGEREREREGEGEGEGELGERDAHTHHRSCTLVK